MLPLLFTPPPFPTKLSTLLPLRTYPSVAISEERIAGIIAGRTIVSRATNISVKVGPREERAFCILAFDWLIYSFIKIWNIWWFFHVFLEKKFLVHEILYNLSLLISYTEKSPFSIHKKKKKKKKKSTSISLSIFSNSLSNRVKFPRKNFSRSARFLIYIRNSMPRWVFHYVYVTANSFLLSTIEDAKVHKMWAFYIYVLKFTGKAYYINFHTI